MYLYPYNIFAMSKNKRLFNPEEPSRTVGIYDVTKINYGKAKVVKESMDDSYISVLLGEVRPGVYLNVLDLDGCTGEMEKEKELLNNFSENEWEYSVSGNGIHVYILTRKKFNTFKLKKYFGDEAHSDLEFYSDKRHIVSTTLNFSEADLPIGKYDILIESLLELYKSENENSLKDDICAMFDGKIVTDMDQFQNSIMAGRTPVTDMHTLRGCGYKDTKLIELIDMEPSCVNQSDHDAALLKKLMYYTLSFESAYDMAKKTNYYKNKDEKHKKKFNNPSYIARTRKFLGV